MPTWLEAIISQFEELCKESREEMDSKVIKVITEADVTALIFASGSMGEKLGKFSVLSSILLTEGAIPEEFRKMTRERIEKILEPFPKGEYNQILSLIREMVHCL